MQVIDIREMVENGLVYFFRVHFYNLVTGKTADWQIGLGK